ncbi:tatB, partial [Symbiodinium necroappetens]
GVGHVDGLHLSPDAMPHLVESLEPFLEDVAAVFSDSSLCSVCDVGGNFDLDRRGQVAAAALGAVPLHPAAGRALRGIGQELAWKLSVGDFLRDKSKILVVCAGRAGPVRQRTLGDLSHVRSRRQRLIRLYEWTWPRQLHEAVEDMREAGARLIPQAHRHVPKRAMLSTFWTPENDIQKARKAQDQQSLNATQCVRAGWRGGESVVGRLGAGAHARRERQILMERSAHLSSAGHASGGTAAATRGDAGDFEEKSNMRRQVADKGYEEKDGYDDDWLWYHCDWGPR